MAASESRRQTGYGRTEPVISEQPGFADIQIHRRPASADLSIAQVSGSKADA
jgi:hypothetical protein